MSEHTLDLSPDSIEHLAMSQALLVTARQRQQANALLAQAIEHERSVAQRIIDSLGFDGQALSLDIAEGGTIRGIVYSYSDTPEDTPTPAEEE